MKKNEKIKKDYSTHIFMGKLTALCLGILLAVRATKEERKLLSIFAWIGVVAGFCATFGDMTFGLHNELGDYDDDFDFDDFDEDACTCGCGCGCGEEEDIDLSDVED